MTHASLDLGDVLRLNVLDTRQFRDDATLCRGYADPDCGFAIYRPACEPVPEAARTTLGAAQEAWLEERIHGATQRWNAFASTVLFSPFALHHNGDVFPYESSWNYVPANRRRLLAQWQDAGLANPVVLSADVHFNWAIDVKADPDDADSATVGAEFLATSLSSGWPPPLDGPIAANLTHNPHVQHYDGRERGYMVHDVTPQDWTCRMRTVDDVRSTAPKAAVQATFAVEAGKPGVQPA